MKKSFLKKKKKSSGEMALQITSMADIFMILLVFLLKNYATSTTNLAPTARLALPEVSKTKGNLKESLKIEISPESILIDQKPVAELRNFEFKPDQGAETEAPRTVLQVLKEQRQLMPEPNQDSSVLVMADQRTPYSTIKRVVAAAAGAGFVDLQLVVVETE